MSRGLPRKVKSALTKSRESALSAVEIYNKPAINFRAGGYIVLMNIAWTSALHAYFFRNKKKPYHRKKGSIRYETIDGDYRHWELKMCLREYFGDDTNNPIRKNLEFFIRIRNKIEHRSYSELDQIIFGECQALLLNYNSFIEEEFGKQYSLKETLAFSLQMYAEPIGIRDAIANNQELNEVVSFIEGYRSSIKKEVFESQSYSFKAFLIQVKNNKKDTLAIKFIKYDSLSPLEQGEIDKIGVVLCKEKVQPIVNAGLKKPGTIVYEVNELLKGERWTGLSFNMHYHTKLWKELGVRPGGRSKYPEKTTEKYCKYDQPNSSYLYTPAWARKCYTEFKKSQSSPDE